MFLGGGNNYGDSYIAPPSYNKPYKRPSYNQLYKRPSYNQLYKQSYYNNKPYSGYDYPRKDKYFPRQPPKYPPYFLKPE